jgi:transcriptional regulator with XRE-family HTH domain
MSIAGWEPHRAIAAGRQLRNRTQQDLADALSLLTGRRWTKNMVASMETGRKAIDPKTLTAAAVWLDLPYSFFLQGVEDEVRALNGAIPGWRNHDRLPDRLSRRILQNGQREQSRVGHGIDGCIDELFDPWVHAVEDYSEERGWFDPRAVREQIPGQTEFIISIEKMLEDVA